MSENYLNGSIPRGLFSLPNVVQVELQDNLFAGGFPNISKSRISSNLDQSILSNNNLFGPLPSSIGNFSAVQKFLKDQHFFSGNIPPEIGRLQQLSSGKIFSVHITREISKCSFLTFVDLSRNNLSDEIPKEIAGMQILNYLNISRNHLDKSIPQSIASMQSLTAVDFPYNVLSGLAPGTDQFSNLNALILCKAKRIGESQSRWTSMVPIRNIEFVLNVAEENGESKLIDYAYSSMIVCLCNNDKVAAYGAVISILNGEGSNETKVIIPRSKVLMPLMNKFILMHQRRQVFDPGGLIIIFLPMTSLDGVELF
ncbi:Leucine-rich repeat receptor-like serine/threonine-protein kinase BAM2 [Dendrobium catenatum]|uniref:Leucine-rich repeat receptor-like serine/threonine-protein kinase BAM2 n=1 Tax=Dendrobium catenatum TaxID=906689 RepID=A0A2I0VYQ9_9ASPA|nr:Leucine-rich repeat receptor-like serine/threonine-protein kinase BAM2 [Dendrobium catenatum]